MNLNFGFEIEEKVQIPELERLGIIKSIWITKHGILYEVRYFDNAKIQEVYFYTHELRKAKK